MEKILKNIILSIFALFTIMCNLIFSQDESFILSASRLSPYFPTYIGNGFFSLSSSQSGTRPAESYMIKVYDKGPDDIPRIACLPAWNEINYFNGIKWLNESFPESMRDTVQLKNYKQTLDMHNGLLTTSYIWDTEDRKTDINVVSFISRENKNLAVIKFEFTADFSDTVELSFPLGERQQPERLPYARLEKIEPDLPGSWPKPWYPGFIKIISFDASADAERAGIEALSQCEGRSTRIAQAVEVRYSGLNNPGIKVSKTDVSASVHVKFVPLKGSKYTFYKIISIASDNSGKSDIQKMALENCRASGSKGFDRLLAEHKAKWKELWNTDIIAEGDIEFQRVIHSMIYYLVSSIEANTDFSISPMGLSSCGYYGHIFWDADTYMFPPLLLMHPEMAKSMVMFRVRTLKSAMENARKNNYKGAMYPWEADELGNETTPYFAYQNALRENHIVGDVALAQWQYFLATRDTSWLRENGLQVIAETADFWTARVHYNKELDRYEIGKLVSVSEGMIDVNNETYTNTVAKINLEIAVRACDLLGIKKNPQWEEISRKIFIPFDEKNQYHPTYENAPGGSKESTEFWTSVSPLLSYPLQLKMSSTAKKNDLLKAVKGLEELGPGANMGSNFLPIIAAELENDSLFNFAIEKTYKGFLRPPFNVLAETHENRSVNFITGAGAFLQQVIFGYTGLRLMEEGLIQKYRPMLPRKIKSLTLKNFVINNERVNIKVEGKTVTIKRLQ